MYLPSIVFVLFPIVFAENVFKLDLPPEEAQQYLKNAPATLDYAEKLGERALPADQGYYRGRILDNPNDYLEQTYLAHQFHGQDGLGKARYGYRDWNQAKVEDIDVHGKTQGAYKYTSNGRTYEAQYYADSEGFHQTDNRPIPKLEPVTDTPAVKAAILAHQKAWSEAAAANLVPSKFPSLEPYNIEPHAQGSEDQYQYERYVHQEPKNEEPTGPPRGFYYSFDYQVPLIIKRSEYEEIEKAKHL